MDQLQPGKSNLVVCSCSDLWSFVLALLSRQRHFLLAFSQKESNKRLADEATQDYEKRHHLASIPWLGSARLRQSQFTHFLTACWFRRVGILRWRKKPG